jgi:hypothetical protein
MTEEEVIRWVIRTASMGLCRIWLEVDRFLCEGANYLGAKSAGMSSVLIDRTGAYGDMRCRKISKLSELLGLLD